MMAAMKNGNLKKKRTDPTRLRRGDLNPPSESGRSLRPRQRRYLDDYEDEDEDFDGEEDGEDEDERGAKGRRKLKLVLKLPPISTVRCPNSSPVTASKSGRASPPDYSPSSSSRSATSSASEDGDDDEEEIVKPLKKRRIERAQDSHGSGHRQERRRNVAQRPIRAVSGTPMPERRVLEPILDRLQKKDTYGVFAEPVNPEELPDYHDVIEHPMDFGTIRRKLATGRYRTFEQFEDDVFLICSNAMQYNAPDTIYFRQAHSIQDIARKSFQEIRASCILRKTERKSEERIITSSTEKMAAKKIQGGSAHKPPSSGFSFMEKTPKQSQCRNAPGPQARDVSSSEKMTLKMPQRRTAPEPLGSDFISTEKKMLKKPQYKAKPEPPGSHISSNEKKMLKRPQYRTIPEPPRSDISSGGKKMVMKPQYRTTPEMLGSDVSSMVKKSLKKHQHRTACGPPGSDIASLQEKEVKKPQHRTSLEPLEFDVSAKEKRTLKKPQPRIVSEAHDLGISSMEKVVVQEPQSRIEHEPLGSYTSSQDKEIQKEQESRTAPDPLDSDGSFGATLASAADVSAADTFIGLSNAPANADASFTDRCTGLTAADANAATVAADASTGLIAAQAGEVERSDTINGSIDENYSQDEIRSEKSDEVPVKSSPSTIDEKHFVVDVTRRETYNTLDEEPLDTADSVFDVFERESRELVEVGLHSEHFYARSLARFAASLGPIGWDIASKKVKQALPPGVKFGPGWVGEYEPLPTPVLSVTGSAQQQQQTKLASKNKAIEKRSETISAASRKDKLKPEAISSSRKEKRNGITSDATPTVPRNENVNGITLQVTQNSQLTNIQFDTNSNRAFTQANDGKERAREQKQGLFGVNLEPTLQPKKNQHNISFEAANSASSTIVSTTRNQAQKPQQQKNQVSCDFSKAYSNETIIQRPELFSIVPKSNFLPVSYVGWNQVGQTEVPKQQLEAVASQRSIMSNWRSPNNAKPNTPFGIISNSQPSVQYWLARGSQEQATNDPLRWMSSSGMISTQPNSINRCTNNVEQSKPTALTQRDNPNAASAQAWMSIGASAGWRPVDGRCVPNPNPNWAMSSPASRAHEEHNIKAELVQGVSENSQAQAKGLVIFPQLMTNDLSRLRSPWQGLVQQNNQKDTLPPDLNISFQPPVSPARSSSGIHIDSQQPDLALQL